MRSAHTARMGAPRWPERITTTPSSDVPTVTVSALGSSANTSIPGSAGFYREKRTGVAEAAASTTPNTVQTSTNALDKAGSTHYAYPGTGTVNPPVGITSNPGQYVRTEFEPGGSAQNAYWPMSIDFITSSPNVAIRVNVTTTSGRVGIVMVNGLRVQEALIMLPSTPVAGSGAEIKLTFGAAASRRITIIGLNQNEGRFGGIAVDSGYSITKPTTSMRYIAFVGDSYVRGAVNTSTMESWIWQCGYRLGAEFILNAGVGSTGFTAILSGQPTSNFAGRTSDVLAENPDIVVIAGGRNDSGSQQSTIESLIQSYIDGGVPASSIYMVPTTIDGSSVRTDTINAAASKAVTFIPISVNSYTKEGDGVHLTLSEHKRFGNEVADRILASKKYAK